MRWIVHWLGWNSPLGPTTAGLIIGLLLTLAGCIVIQSVPERRVDPSLPVARVIIEQRQAQPVPLPVPRGGS